MTSTQPISAQLESQRQALHAHPLTGALLSLDAWRTFMQVHVFAVFDFMSLLKRLQLEFTCTTLPWRPPAHPEAARLINEIVLGEETDLDAEGRPSSHFELYLKAMAAIGADTAPVLSFLALLDQGIPWAEALERAHPPACVKPFVQQTLGCAVEGQVHEVAAAFFYGREDVLPQLFANLQTSLEGSDGTLQLLQQYFSRHIELDGDHHGPMARRLLEVVCAGDAKREREAQATALASLVARRQLWDAVVELLQ